MNHKEKYRTQTLINNICSGGFAHADVEVLLIRIREHIKYGSITRELGDFVAHTRRDKGITFSALELVYFAFKYAYDYSIKGLKVDLSLFPSYIKNYLLLLVDKIPPTELGRARKKKSELLSTIRKIEINSLINAGCIKEITHTDVENVNFILRNPAFPEVYNQKIIINEIIQEISSQGYYINKDQFLSQSNKITLCIFDLINLCEVEFITGEKGQLELGSTVEEAGAPGNLIMYASVPAFDSSAKLQLEFINTDMDIQKYVDESMLDSTYTPKYNPLNINWSCKYFIDYRDCKIKLKTNCL